MQDLLKDLKQNAGLTDEQAVKAVEIMKTYILAKVPPMFSGFVHGFFAKSADHSSDDITELPSR